jgi:hypothetical protein
MILRGLFMLARGRVTGVLEFANSDEALFASLAPLIAFPLVGAGIKVLYGQPVEAAAWFLARLCAVLALPVMIREIARAAGQEASWLRTATALNWSFWMVLPVLLVAAIIGAVLEEAGVNGVDAEFAALGAMLAWLLWYQWFIIRAGLKLGVWPAAGAIGVISLTIVILTDGPWLIQQLCMF